MSVLSPAVLAPLRFPVVAGVAATTVTYPAWSWSVSNLWARSDMVGGNDVESEGYQWGITSTRKQQKVDQVCRVDSMKEETRREGTGSERGRELPPFSIPPPSTRLQQPTPSRRNKSHPQTDRHTLRLCFVCPWRCRLFLVSFSYGQLCGPSSRGRWSG